MELTVYVPTNHTDLGCYNYGIRTGSALIGTPDTGSAAPEMLRVDYEGDQYGFIGSHCATHADRYCDYLMHAADRHTSRYPTSARVWINLTDPTAQGLTVVGYYLPAADGQPARFDATDPETLDAWLEPLETNTAEVLAVLAQRSHLAHESALMHKVMAGDTNAMIALQTRRRRA